MDRPAVAAPSATVLEVTGLSKTYTLRGQALTVLSDVSFALAAGDSCAIVGPSGSGKSTLLGLCAGLERPDRGTVRLAGALLNDLGEDARARLRGRCSGFVFQSFQLIPTLTAQENVMAPLELQGLPQAAARAADMLGRVGLGDRLRHYPSQLSGGEQQRVALARAFVHEPQVLFADEPTGNLDAETGARIADLLFELNASHNTTLLLVTHDPTLAARTARAIRLRAGRLVDA